MWKCCEPFPVTAGTLATAKNVSGPMSVTCGLTEPQPPPPLTPIYQPVQPAAATMGGALIGISAAFAVPVSAKTAAARTIFRMACPLESLRITNDYTRTPLRNMLPAGHTGKKSGKLCISAPGRPDPPARRAPAGAHPHRRALGCTAIQRQTTTNEHVDHTFRPYDRTLGETNILRDRRWDCGRSDSPSRPLSGRPGASGRRAGAEAQSLSCGDIAEEATRYGANLP